MKTIFLLIFLMLSILNINAQLIVVIDYSKVNKVKLWNEINEKEKIMLNCMFHKQAKELWKRMEASAVIEYKDYIKYKYWGGKDITQKVIDYIDNMGKTAINKAYF